MTPEMVLDFWFKEHGPKEWFAKDEAFDEKVREKFGALYEAARKGEYAAWRETPRGRLAEILVLDQFPRQLFRGTARAFESDALALSLADEAVRTEADRKLSGIERQFLYMPFMHSESKAVHAKAFWLFFSLLPWQWNSFYYEWLHKRMIDRFGRYPYRNALLSRGSTPEEIEFLKTNKGF